MGHFRAGWAVALALLMLPAIARADDPGSKAKESKPPEITRTYDQVRDRHVEHSHQYEITDIGMADAVYSYFGDKPLHPSRFWVHVERPFKKLDIPGPKTLTVYLRYGDTRTSFEGHPVNLIDPNKDDAYVQWLDLFIQPAVAVKMWRADKVLIEVDNIQSSIKGEALAAFREMVKDWPAAPPDVDQDGPKE